MKKFIEEKHDLLAGIFAILALIAIVCEVPSKNTASGSMKGNCPPL